MTLTEYLARTKGGRTAIARAAGIRWQTVDEIARGQVTPRVTTARAISAATEGAVSVAELLGLSAHDMPTGGHPTAKRKAARTSRGAA